MTVETFNISPTNRAARIREIDAVYATAHDAATGIVGVGATLILSNYHISGSYRIARWALVFDTSSLPDDAEMISLILRFKLMEYQENQAFNIVVVSGADIGDPPVASNYGDLLDDTISRGSFPSSSLPAVYQLFDIELNEVARGEVNPTGLTEFGLRHSKDISNTTPPSETFEWVTVTGGTASPTPQLIVEYASASLGPTVTTQECTDTIAEKTTGHGLLYSKGSSEVTQHGHVWATSVDPDTTDSKTENGAKPNLGQFTSAITGLIPNTTYYVRAYATNTEGTSYGDNVTIGSSSTIGRRDWWVERDEFHFISEWGVEQKVKGTSVANDQDILAHLGL